VTADQPADGSMNPADPASMRVVEQKSLQPVQSSSPAFVTIPMPRGLELTKSPGMHDASLDAQHGAMYAPEERPQADLDLRAGEAMAAGALHAAAAAVPDPKPIMTMRASPKAASSNHQLAGLQTKHDTMTALGEKDPKLADPAAGLGGEGGSPATLSADKMGQSQMQADGQQSEEDDVDDVSSDDVLDEDDGVSDIPDGASESASLSLVPQPSTLSEGRGVRATSLWWESLLRKTHSQGDSVLKREPSRGFSRSNTAEDYLSEASLPADSARRNPPNVLRPSDSDSSVNPAWKAMSDLAGADNELAAVLVRRKQIAEGALR